MLSPADLSLLGRLDIAYRRPASGVYAGERRSTRAARSPEFADFRPYSSGDDFRQIDWKAYARLERLMLRLYVAEEEACLNVVVDTSASMVLGSPSKWPSALKLAAALGFLGLAGMDRVQAGGWDGAAGSTPALRGASGAGRLWTFLAGLRAGGGAPATPDQLGGLRWLKPGLTVLISDFLTEGDWARVLSGLRRRRQETVLWQVLGPDEEDPQLRGDLKLLDVEAEGSRELTITPVLLAAYRQSLEAHRARLRMAAGAAQGRLLHSTSSDGLAAMMLAGLRAGVVRRG